MGQIGLFQKESRLDGVERAGSYGKRRYKNSDPSHDAPRASFNLVSNFLSPKHLKRLVQFEKEHALGETQIGRGLDFDLIVWKKAFR